MKKYTTILAFLILVSFINPGPKRPVDYVNPFIGTGGHGHTYPGVCLPFGMVQLSPDTRLTGWDGCSGYHFSDSIVYGFSHTHLNGTGCSDYGDILLMPFVGIVPSTINNFASDFNHAKEKAGAGYYNVHLNNGDIDVELTATSRVGFHKYTFNKGGLSNVLIDLVHRDEVIESSIKFVGDNEIEGYRRSKAWADDQRVFFVARFSQPFKIREIAKNDTIVKKISSLYGKSIKAYIQYLMQPKEELMVKVAISAVSIEGARKNLDVEIPGWDFVKVKTKAQETWNKELSKIEIEGNETQKTTFYTALYHAFINPNLYIDADRQYRGRDTLIHKSIGFDFYTVFSLWDTYRAEHPLFTIIEQKRTSDFINTFIRQFEEAGRLPVWELSSNETDCMIGYHSVSVIADAYLKGIKGFDIEKAYTAMKFSADENRSGLEWFRKFGFIPAEKESESVSKALEYAYDDWCIAQVAKALNKTEDYNRYMECAQYYKNVFDASTGFMRAKVNAGWFSPFDPTEVNFNYTEANSWQYSYYVPQDVSGITALMGGKEKFAQRLDSLFITSSKTTGREQADMTGMIGQYAHGNEPSHHAAYLFNYLGKPAKTERMVHTICQTLYNNTTEGLCGNDDCGQMSAWYVMSALGIYQVTPASQDYVIGSPMFSKATIHLENGKQFTIVAKNVSDQNYYISASTLNGKPHNQSFITHKDIMQGGELVFEMTSNPNTNWATADADCPVSKIIDHVIEPVPFVAKGDRSFNTSIKIELVCIDKESKIHYTIDGTEPDLNSPVYTKPIEASQTITVKAFAHKDGFVESKIIQAIFRKVNIEGTIKLFTKYTQQYSAGGENALYDGIRGDNDFRNGTWQGYEKVDVNAVIDFGRVKPVNKLSTGFLQDINSWIFMPVEVEYFTSNDGVTFKSVGIVKNEVPVDKWGSIIKDFSLKLDNVQTRYIKVIGKNLGNCPKWHKGYPNPCHIFADEIVVE